MSLNPRKNVQDGRKEIDPDGKETGKIWSNKFNDYIIPNLEQIHEDYRPQAEKNIRICYNCVHWIRNQRRCRVCGCFMDLKGIAWRLFDSNASACPLGKW